MKHSIRRRIALTFIGLVVLAIALIGVLNYTLLPRYYTKQKMNILEKSWQMFNGVEQIPGGISDETMHFCINNNLDIVVTDSEMKMAYSNAGDSGRMISRLFGYAALGDERKREILKENKEYQVQQSYDPQVGVDYLELWGELDSGGYYIARCPLESIREASMISNRFFFITGFLVLILGCAAIWMITKKLVNPLQELSVLSRRMAALDFDVKYQESGEEELDELGSNFNKMSEKLEETITELKSANLELKKDIQEKMQIDEMRKEFLSNVTHELKTPIALIQGYAEGLKECVQDDPQSRDFYCDVIIDESGKMNHMVQQLLNLNQLEAGNEPVHMERFCLAGLVRGVLQSCQILIDQKQAKILMHIPEQIYVWGDEFQVEEVVANYLTNALNHLEGENIIEITCEECDDFVRTTIFNTGKPIPAEDVDKIWIKFYKVDKARTREYGGSGIGLSIVKAIMDSMRQKCGVTNYDNGVAFWFTLESK